MRKPTKALVALLLCAAVSVDADVVRTRGGGSGGGAAAAVTPGVTTVTGCQNRVIFGDNSSVLNCEAALSYTASTDVLGVTSLNGPAADNCATPPYSFSGDTNTGVCTQAADTLTFWTAGGQAGTVNQGNWTIGPAATRIATISTTAILTRSGVTIGWSSSATDAGGGADTLLGREATAVVQFGSDVNGAPVNQTIKSHDGITGTDVAGSSFLHAAGRGTGAGSPGDFIVQTATPLATGTTAQTLTSRHHIEGTFRALTDATATTVFTVGTGNDVSCGGTLFFTVEAADAANQQSTTGSVNFAAADNAAGAGGEACSAAVTGTNATAATSGTLTVTSDATTGTDLCNIRLTATGSLTETVGPRVRYSILLNPMSSTCNVTPQ